MGRLTDAIKHLLIINVLFFVATVLYNDMMIQWFALWFPKNELFGWWQFVSHMFMHGSPEHIFFNMFTLWMFGTSLELAWGKNKFLFFFFSAGIGAALFQTAVNYFQFDQGLSELFAAGLSEYEIMNTLEQGKYSPNWYDFGTYDAIDNMIKNFAGYLVGASGATSGIMVAFAFMYPNRELFPIPIKVKYAVPLLFVGDIYYGFSGGGGNIAYFAHIGGALFGLVMVWYWKKNSFNKNRWD